MKVVARRFIINSSWIRCASLWAVLLTVSFLLGCTTAITSGAQAAYNHNDIQSTLHDQSVTLQVDHAIHWNTDHFQNSRVAVSTFNDVVVLTGQVPTQALHDELTQVAKNATDSQEIYNLTTVSDPAPTLTRMHDALITATIKARLLAEQDINPSQIKVVTENGTVFLIGIIFPNQANIATRIAQTTDGVGSVVRVFSYLEIRKKI